MITGRREFMSPVQVPAPLPPPAPRPRRLEEGTKFDSLWDNLPSSVPSSLEATSSIEQPEGQEALREPAAQAVSASAESAAILTASPTLEPITEPAAPSLSPSPKPVAEGESGVQTGLTSSPATSVENPELSQEVIPPTLASPVSIPDSEEARALVPIPPSELAPASPTRVQTDEEKARGPAAKPDEPSPDDASSSLPPDMPRSSMLRTMVGLLRTGFRGTEGGARRS
jgi:hypothetical protein